jgi:hypothetical protein
MTAELSQAYQRLPTLNNAVYVLSHAFRPTSYCLSCVYKTQQQTAANQQQQQQAAAAATRHLSTSPPAALSMQWMKTRWRSALGTSCVCALA